MKYAIGDAVTIRPDLQIGVYGGEKHVNAVSEMLQYRGQTTTITYFTSSFNYRVSIDNGEWIWTSDMFVDEPPMVPISDEECKKLLFS
jgi:hypothetical protein